MLSRGITHTAPLNKHTAHNTVRGPELADTLNPCDTHSFRIAKTSSKKSRYMGRREAYYSDITKLSMRSPKNCSHRSKNCRFLCSHFTHSVALITINTFSLIKTSVWKIIVTLITEWHIFCAQECYYIMIVRYRWLRYCIDYSHMTWYDIIFTTKRGRVFSPQGRFTLYINCTNRAKFCFPYRIQMRFFVDSYMKETCNIWCRFVCKKEWTRSDLTAYIFQAHSVPN